MDSYSFLDDMSFHSLQNLRSYHPSWRLLAATSAPSIISFLYSVFVSENCRELPEYILVGKLEQHLARIEEQTDIKWLLTHWSDDSQGYLRKFYPAGSDEVHYDLTSAAQKAIEWVESLYTRSFIGTESRLMLVFQLFHEIARQSDEDPERRMQELERRKSELDDEMLRVIDGHISVLEPVQIKERYMQAMNLSREILSDFRAVEQNFRELRRNMQEKISKWDEGKGKLLGSFFRDQDNIQQSDQGRSFAAFFDFLLSKAAQDDFEQTIREVGALDAVKQIPGSQNAHRIIRDWVDGSKHVQETLAAVSEQLRRYVDETFLAEERRINQTIKGILGSAVTLRNDPPSGVILELDAQSPKLILPFDRPLYIAPESLRMDDVELSYGDDSGGDHSALYSTISVDKTVLLRQIQHLTEDHDEVSLAQVITVYPIKLGLAELIGYLSLAQDQRVNAALMPHIYEPIRWQDSAGYTHKADFCRIVYRRNTEEMSRNG
jgi:hypothetical protein